MRSRLAIFLNDLTLEEILYLREELDRQTEQYRKRYSVLAVQSDRPLLRAGSPLNLPQLTRDMRRFFGECAAKGGGTVLAFSPEASAFLFHGVRDAGTGASALLGGLAELNGKGGAQSYGIQLKMGLASGEDMLTPGSPRCVRASVLVKRANQCAWRSTAGTLLMDETSYQEWPDKHSPTRVPFEIDGFHVYRTVPGSESQQENSLSNEALVAFVNRVVDEGISTLKYDMVRIDAESIDSVRWGKAAEMLEFVLEAYDPHAGKNLKYAERIATAQFSERIDSIRRLLATMGLAIVRLEQTSATSV